MSQEALYNFNKKLKIPNNSIRHVLQFTTNEIYVSPTTPANRVITACNYSHFTLQYDANCAVFCIKSHAILTLIATSLTTRHEKGESQ